MRIKKGNHYYILKDVNKSCIFFDKSRRKVVTRKLQQIVNYREHRVDHLIKFLKIHKIGV